MTKKRIATMATCIALVGAVAVGGTLALLTAPSNAVTNTFTVGTGYEDGDFTLKENGVDQVSDTTHGIGGYRNNAQVIDTTTGDQTLKYGNVVTNTKLDKNPWFELSKNASTPSWIIAQVSGVSELASAGLTISSVAEDTNWKLINIADEGEDVTYTLDVDALVPGDIKDGAYYVFTNQLTAGNETDKLFTQLQAGEEVTLDSTTGKSLVIKGVAVQAVPGDVMDNETLQSIAGAAITALN